jgi:hypothetical protein
VRVVEYRGKIVKHKEPIDFDRVLLTFKDGTAELVTPQMWQMYKQDRFHKGGKNGNKGHRRGATDGSAAV